MKTNTDFSLRHFCCITVRENNTGHENTVNVLPDSIAKGIVMLNPTDNGLDRSGS